MYKLEKYENGGALSTNADIQYSSTFNADSIEQAEGIAIDLNRAVLINALAVYRFNVEVGGLSLGDGMSVKTDRESQSQLSNCFVDLKHGLVPDTDWKGSLWQLVDLQQIEPIAKAVAAHRRGCFRGERLVQEAINDAQTVAELEVINIIKQFDAAYQEAYAQVMTAEQATE